MLISNKSDYNKFKRLYDSLSPQDKYLYHINDPAVDNPQLYRRITDKGAIILSPYKGKINKATVSVVVDPTARGLGVGTQLGKDAIRWSSINKV